MDRNKFFTAALLSLSAAMGFFAIGLCVERTPAAAWLFALAVISFALFIFLAFEFTFYKR